VLNSLKWAPSSLPRSKPLATSRSRHKQIPSGITLIELMVGIALLAGMGIFIANFLGKTTTQFVVEETKTKVAEEARTFIGFVKKDGQFASEIRTENTLPLSPGSSVQTSRELIYRIRRANSVAGNEPIETEKRYRTECIAAPSNIPPLPATQDCMTCPAGQAPIVVSVENGVTTRVFPAGSLELFGRAFAGTLCPSQNSLLPGLTLTLVAYARLPENKLYTYSIEAALPVPVPEGSDIQFLRKF